MKSSHKQTRNATESRDVESVNAVIKALYECVTFAPGTQPDYQRLRSLFHPRGRLTPPKDRSDLVLDIETFISNSREHVILTGLEKKGFHEKEVHRSTEVFGNIVHAFSTYESRHLPTDEAPIQRGINSIQLVFDNERWWVVSIMWDIERDNNPLPSQYIG